MRDRPTEIVVLNVAPGFNQASTYSIYVNHSSPGLLNTNSFAARADHTLPSFSGEVPTALTSRILKETAATI